MNKKRDPDMFDIMFANPEIMMEQASNIVQARRRSRQAKRAVIVIAVTQHLAGARLAPSLLGG